MTYEENFKKLKKILMRADVSKIKEDLAFQFNILGEGEGIFYAAIKDGELSVEPYDYNDRDAMFIATANVFTQIAQGKLKPSSAFSTGKLKIEGDIEKAREIQKIVAK